MITRDSKLNVLEVFDSPRNKTVYRRFFLLLSNESIHNFAHFVSCRSSVNSKKRPADFPDCYLFCFCGCKTGFGMANYATEKVTETSELSGISYRGLVLGFDL